MTTLSMKSPILEQSAGSAGSGGSAGSAGNGGSRVRADPPPTRAGGQDDGSLPSSLKLIAPVEVGVDFGLPSDLRLGYVMSVLHLLQHAWEGPKCPFGKP